MHGDFLKTGYPLHPSETHPEGRALPWPAMGDPSGMAKSKGAKGSGARVRTWAPEASSNWDEQWVHHLSHMPTMVLEYLSTLARTKSPKCR